MDDLIEFGEVRRGSMGYFEAIPLTPELAREIGVAPTRSGIVVVRLDRRSAAHGAGLQPADVIVAFDGRPVEEIGQLQRLISDAPIGSTVRLTVLRGERELTLDVPIAQAVRRTARGL